MTRDDTPRDRAQTDEGAAQRTAEETRAFVDASAAVLGLSIRPEWTANVAMFVDVARGMAARVAATGAGAASEAAPVFTPRPLASPASS